jgi:nicotinate-nucleotide adenylyltransferase
MLPFASFLFPLRPSRPASDPAWTAAVINTIHINTIHINYGGTFDPVHNGHLAVARSAAEQLRGVVHLVPGADPPHRARPAANAAQRAEMLRLAIGGDARLALDLRELRRGGASYTVDTLRELRVELGADFPIACLVGVDAYRGLASWRDWRELFELAHLVVLTRPGHTLDELAPELDAETAARRCTDTARLAQSPAGCVLTLDVPAWPVSSTQVRAAIASNGSLAGLVPPLVADYMETCRLYR